MSNAFREDLRKLFETYGYRQGFGNQTPELPVVGMDYQEHEPLIAPESGPENVIDDKNDEQLINMLNDILVAAPGNTEVQGIISKAKDLINGVDDEREGVDQPDEEIPDEPTVDMDPTFGAQSPEGAGGAAQGMAESEVVDNPPGSVDPLAGEMTSGETLPMGANRVDGAEMGCPSPDYDSRDDNMAEIASLLVTIGHILQSARHIPSKFDVPMVLKYINQNFGQQTPDDMQAMYESYNMEEGKLGKGLAALGMAGAAMAGGNAPAAEKGVPVQTDGNRTETSITNVSLDPQTMINLRMLTQRIVAKYIMVEDDPTQLGRDVTILMGVATQVLANGLDVESAMKRVPPSMRQDPKQETVLRKYFDYISKLKVQKSS